MTVTLIGVAVIAIGLLLLLRGSMTAMLSFVLYCALMNGSGTIIFPALNNVSLPPALLAAMFLGLRCLLPGGAGKARLIDSVGANGWLVLFVSYGVVGAFTAPFVFAGAIDVVPLRPTGGSLAVYPLGFTTQNITTAVYMTTTLVTAICVGAAATYPGAGTQIARTLCNVGALHCFIGWFGIATNGTAAAAITKFFRNGYYAQLDQSFGGILRITGISPEPSLYASFAFAVFIFVTELWQRNILASRSGPVAATLLVTLLASTSSTAYVGLAAYAAVLLLRTLSPYRTMAFGKGIAVMAVALILVTFALGLLAAQPALTGRLAEIFAKATVDKLDSSSGIERAFMARQGFEAFVRSGGLGIGIGSFRSSSILTAILGSTGIIGSVAFLVHLARVWAPWRRSTYVATGNVQGDIGAAASWTALMILVPQAVAAPSPDPGLLWGTFAGIAIALRKPIAVQSGGRSGPPELRERRL